MDVLSKMEQFGRSEHEIYEKAMSWGVTEQTARSYLNQLRARREN